jgi:HlyD family secretion protein
VKKWILIGAGVVVLGVILVANLTRSDVPSVKARTTKVERADITSHITAPGKVQAVASVDLSAEVPGRVEKLYVAEGDSVTKDDLLLRLDDDQYQSRVDQAVAAIKSARANLALSRARLDKLEKDKARQEALSEQGLTSAQALEQATTDYAVQKADVEARSQAVNQAEAALQDARDNLEKTEYRAPVSGIVSRLNIEEGEIVVVGTMNNPGTVVMSIADLSKMEVDAEVDETDVVHVAPGQSAEISVDAIPDTTFEGTVATVGSSGRGRGLGTADEAINFEVKVRFDHFDPRLKPGMTADVDVATQTRDSVLTVPIQALVARSRGTLERNRQTAAKWEGGKAAPNDTPADSMDTEARQKWEKEILEGVYRLTDGKAEFVPVTSGIADDVRIEVKGDLKVGDEVVSGPYTVLRDLKQGTHIKVTSGRAGGKDKD